MKSNPLIPVSDVLTTKFSPFNQHMINFITFLGIFYGWCVCVCVCVCVYLYTSSLSLFFNWKGAYTVLYFPPFSVLEIFHIST